HMTGLRLLAPHLNTENVAEVLAEATGKSTRQIEELVARLAPQPRVPTVIRKVPAQMPPEYPPRTLFGSAGTAGSHESSPATVSGPVPASAGVSRGEERRAVIQPLAEETFKFQ